MRAEIVAVVAIAIAFVLGSTDAQCSTRYTTWKDSSNGNLVYLDRHRLNCGHDRVALRSFKMETRHFTTTYRKWWRRKTRNHYHIRYRYQCCSLPTNPGSSVVPHYCGFTKEVTNTFTYDGKGNAVYLDRQRVECTQRGLLNDFWLERNPPHNNRVRYHYYCCSIRSIYWNRLSCQTKVNVFTYDGEGKLFYLDRQDVRCDSGYYISYFRLERNGAGDSWRYIYRCCKID